MAKISDQDIEALREKADFIDLVSRYTTLKRSGSRWTGLCPFHTEKTPSFSVDPAKGLVYCFGCGEGGNIYQFVQKVENLPFVEAVEWLARRENFELHYEQAGPGAREAAGLKARLREANAAASRFFHSVLMESPEAAEARRYLGSRGFGRDVAERWELGYAPGRDALYQHLTAKGFKREELVAADLVKVSERDGNVYDSFRQRIIFPTWNLQGDVVAFGGRALLPDQKPKYLNTSDTPVFSKSRVMYGLDRARSAIARGSAAVIVEGYTDVIALHEGGVKEAVATNGVALGVSHFEQLKRFTSRAVLMFDADDAGKAATERGYGVHHRIGVEVMVAPLPAGRDPADVVKEDGAEGIRKVIDGAQPLLEFKLEQTIARLPLDTPEARSAAVGQVVEVLLLQPDPIARHEYVFMAAGRIGVDPEVIQRALTEERRGTSDPSEGVVRERDRRLPGHVKVEREALQLLLLHHAEARPWAEQIGESDLTSATRRELFKAACERAQGAGPAGFAQQLSPDASALLSELIVGVEDLPPQELEERVREVFTRLRIFSLERDIKARRSVLHDVNPLEDPERHDRLFTELVGLEAERRDLLRVLQGEG